MEHLTKLVLDDLEHHNRSDALEAAARRSGAGAEEHADSEHHVT